MASVALGTVALLQFPTHRVAALTTPIAALPAHAVVVGTTAITPLPPHRLALGTVAIPAPTVQRIAVGTVALHGFVSLTPVTGAVTGGGVAALSLAALLAVQTGALTVGGTAQLTAAAYAAPVYLSALPASGVLGGVLPDASRDVLALSPITSGGHALLVGGVPTAAVRVAGRSPQPAANGARQVRTRSNRVPV